MKYDTVDEEMRRNTDNKEDYKGCIASYDDDVRIKYKVINGNGVSINAWVCYSCVLTND